MFAKSTLSVVTPLLTRSLRFKILSLASASFSNDPKNGKTETSMRRALLSYCRINVTMAANIMNYDLFKLFLNFSTP